jgi:probable HAF family extracellular repeat protein
MRTAIVAAAIAFFLSGGGPSAGAEPQYAVTDLGTLGGSTSKAYAINNEGQVVGTASVGGDNQHAFIYDSNGGMKDLGTFQDDVSSCAYAINGTGLIVGYSQSSGTAQSAVSWAWNSGTNAWGTATSLLAPQGTINSRAYGVNDSGTVVGWAQISSGTASTITALGGGCPIGHAVVFGARGSDLFGALSGDSCAYGINNSGNTVGRYQPLGSNIENAFLLEGSTLINPTLGTVAGLKSCARAINDANDVVGYSQIDSGATHAFLYTHDGTITDLKTLGGLESRAYALNSDDDVVGWSDTSEGKVHAFLYEDKQMLDLNSLVVSNPDGLVLEEARGINDGGYIVGWGEVDGNTHAFLLTPVPEPSTFALIAIGAVSLLAYAWRRRTKTA